MGKNHGNSHTFDGGFKGTELNSGLSIAMFAGYMENIWRFRQPRCFEDGYSYLFQETMGIQQSNMGIFHGILGECMVNTCIAEINCVTKVMGTFDTNIALIDGCSSF